MDEQRILEELQQPDIVKPWYLTWWGVIVLLVFFAIGIFISMFVANIYRFKVAFETNNQEVLQEAFIDASSYGKVGDMVSRLEVETGDDPFWGNPQAKVVIVEFSDFGCPYCRQNVAAITRLRGEYADRVKFIYRDMPLTYLHPEALIAAQAGSCANDQKMFWQYHDLLFAYQGQYSTVEELVAYAGELDMDVDTFSQCLTSKKYEAEALNDMQEGIRFGVKGTPTFYINGLKLSGVVSYETFKAIIDRYLERTANE